MEAYDAARTLRLGARAPWFTEDDDLNVFGVRLVARTTDLFDDLVVFARVHRGAREVRVFAATTDPGRAYLKTPMNALGTAALVPGHYPGSHELGLHSGYPALVQRGDLRVYRDNDRNGDLSTLGPSFRAGPGCRINLHGAGDDEVADPSAYVGRWSAGCQVIRRRSHLRELVRAVEDQRDAGHGTVVSYTLIDARRADQVAVASLLANVAG